MRTPYEQNIMTPVVSGPMVLVSGYTRGCIAKAPGRKGAEELWRNGDISVYMSTPVFHGRRFYAHDRQGRLMCASAEDGRLLWRQSGFGQHASLIRSGGRLLVLSEAGELVLVDADADEYSELWRLKVCGRTWVHHAAANGRLYVRDGGGIKCLGMGE